jgi:class 3 adenylate cyclase
MAAPTTRVRTFLIADVRGYTAFTQAHGDQAAADLAAAFAEIVREGVEVRGRKLQRQGVAVAGDARRLGDAGVQGCRPQPHP